MFVPSCRLIARTQHCFEYKMLLVMVRDTRRTDMQSNFSTLLHNCNVAANPREGEEPLPWKLHVRLQGRQPA